MISLETCNKVTGAVLTIAAYAIRVVSVDTIQVFPFGWLPSGSHSKQCIDIHILVKQRTFVKIKITEKDCQIRRRRRNYRNVYLIIELRSDCALLKREESSYDLSLVESDSLLGITKVYLYQDLRFLRSEERESQC